jgi:hypothetical protein
MMAIVDGTGPYGEQDYQLTMARSFCYQLSTGVKNARYWEGPGSLGITTRSKGNQAYDWIGEYIKENNKEPVFLAGYSRGGATVIQVAKWLRQPTAAQPRINVEAMFLFDPVARDLALDADGIPDNVKHCYVVFRDQNCEVKNVAWKPNWGYGQDPDMDIYARKWMGNCQVAPDNRFATHVAPKRIRNASHGAVGGVPWTDRPADEAATKEAASWMNQWLRRHGLNMMLRDMWLVNKRTGSGR